MTFPNEPASKQLIQKIRWTFKPFPRTLMKVKSSMDILLAVSPSPPAAELALLDSSMEDSWEEDEVTFALLFDASELSEIDRGFFLDLIDILSPVRPSWASSRAICLALIPQLLATFRWHLWGGYLIVFSRCLPFVDVQFTLRTLKTLVKNSVKHRSTMITEGRTPIWMNYESVWHIDIEPSHSLLKLFCQSWLVKS